MPLSSLGSRGSGRELTRNSGPYLHEHLVHRERGPHSRCAIRAAAALQRFAGHDRGTRDLHAGSGMACGERWNALRRNVARWVGHPGACHGHGLNAKCRPSKTATTAHDIAAAFVGTVPIFSAKRASAVGAVNPDVNGSHRRYDSEVAMTLVHGAWIDPLWANFARDALRKPRQRGKGPGPRRDFGAGSRKSEVRSAPQRRRAWPGAVDAVSTTDRASGRGSAGPLLDAERRRCRAAR